MKPLEGYLVVTAEQAVAAPLCTQRLADAGARVIKIEREAGDFARGYDTAGKGDSSYFVWTNQGKESLVLDFKSEEGAALMEKLLTKADVFVQNLAPDALARAGFGSDDLRNRHPRLVTCDISGYGDSQDMKDMKAYDFLVQAETGLVSISGGPGEMGRIGVSVTDIGAGMTAHAAIMEALLKRERTGEGAGVKVSLFDVTAEWMTVPYLHQAYGKGAPEREGLRHPSIAPYGSYETGDGALTIVAIQNEREWSRFCGSVLKKPETAIDERFSSNNARVANRNALDEQILAVSRTLDHEEFRHRLLKAAIAFGALNSVEDLTCHPALRRRHVITSEGETLDLPAPPIRWAGIPLEPGKGTPKIGQHTDAIKDELA